MPKKLKFIKQDRQRRAKDRLQTKPPIICRPLRTMSDTSHFDAAWTDYRNRRRWLFGILLGGLVVVILLTGIFAHLLGDLAFYIFGPAWLLSYAVAGVRLSLFLHLVTQQSIPSQLHSLRAAEV